MAALANSSKRPSSQEFSDQIRNLEMEGNKLMEATHQLGDSLGVPLTSSVNRSVAAVPSPLSSLADYYTDQHTINTLRTQLDTQSREAERLTRDMLGGQYTSRNSSILDKLELPHSSTINRTSGYNLTMPTTLGSGPLSHTDGIPRTVVDQQLKDSRIEVQELRSQLSETITMNERQKEQFRTTIAELRGQLQEAVITRDSAIHTKQEELMTHEALLKRLQQTVEQQENTCHIQEETLLDMNSKLEAAQRERSSVELALGALRGVVMEQERKRGRPYFDSDPVHKQSVSLFVRSLDTCIHELDGECLSKTQKMVQLATEFEDFKLLVEEKQRAINQENQNRFGQLQREAGQQVDVAGERCENARKESSGLQDQLALLQHQGEQQLKLKEEHIGELERRLASLREDYEEERQAWREKREALEHAVEDTQRELSLVKQERDENIRTTAVLEVRYNDMRQAIVKLEKEAESERSQRLEAVQSHQVNHEHERELTNTLKQRDDTIRELTANVKQSKQEAQTQLQHTVANLEKEGKQKVADQLKALELQLTTLSDKYHHAAVELELTKTHSNELKTMDDNLQQDIQKSKEQLEAAAGKLESCEALLRDRQQDVERLTHERDQYFKLLDERNTQLTTVTGQKQTLTVQLEEREKHFLSVQQQQEKLSFAADSHDKTVTELRTERDELLKRMNEKIIETEEIRHSRDSVSKKLRVRDKHIQELQEDNVKLAEELRGGRSEFEMVMQQKAQLLEELQKSRYEVATLSQDVVSARKKLEVKRGDVGKEINRLMAKLRTTEHDLKLARKALKVKDNADGKAMKVAGQMQKQVTEKRSEIDVLQSRIRLLEDQQEAIAKEKEVLQEDNEKLSSAVHKSAQQNERMAADLHQQNKSNHGLKDRISKMESALEKAAVKHATSQAQVEQYEQELARQKLKHQLSIKEVQRPGKFGSSQVSKDGGGAMVSANVLTSLLSCGSFAPDTAKGTRLSNAACEEIPVSQKPTQEQLQALAAENGVGMELKKLIGEMRDLICQQRTHTPQSQGSQGWSVNSPVNDAHLQDSQPHRDNLRPKRHKHHKQAVPRTQSNQNGRVSPVSDLLVIDSCVDNDQDIDDESGCSMDFLDVTSSAGQSCDAQTVCQRLERKIESLSKMGGDLQKENKDIARMMKDQEKKLHQVKGQMA